MRDEVRGGRDASKEFNWRKVMKKKIHNGACAVVMAVGAAFLPLKAAEVFTVEAGGTFEVTDANNVDGNRLDVTGNATLKLSGTATDGAFPVRLDIRFFNETSPVTLAVDASGVTDCTTVRMTGDTRDISRGGVLALPSGISEFVIGTAERGKHIDLNFPLFDMDVTFDAEGGKVVFTNDSSVVKFPSCSYSISEGARIATFGNQVFGSGDYSLSVFDVELCSYDSFEKGSVITVPPGRTLYFRPCVFANEYTGKWSGTGELHTTNDVSLGGSGASLSYQNNNSIKGLLGNVTGEGDIYFRGNGNVMLSGELDYRGTLTVDGLKVSYPNTYTLCPSNNAAISPGIVVKHTYGAVFRVSPTGVEQGSPTRVSLSSFTGTTAASAKTNAVLHVAANQSLAVGAIAGEVELVADGENASVVVDTLAANARLYLQSGVSLTVNSLEEGAEIVLKEDASGNRNWTVCGAASDAAISIPFEMFGEYAEAASLALGGRIKVAAENVLDVESLRILSGAEISANIADGVKIENEGGIFRQLSWKDKVALWVDASVEDTFRYARNVWKDKTKIQENQLVEWLDCRADRRKDGDLRIAVTPFGEGGAEPSKDAHWISFPYVDTIDGLKCVWMAPKSGRAFVATGFSKDGATSVKTKFALLVFNGRNGGGNALLGTQNTRLKRLESPLETPTADMVSSPLVVNALGLQFRTNGVDIASPAETPLAGGWQIITLSVEDGLDVGSICYHGINNSGSYNGGQIFAEIILFDKMPTQEERDAAESYLAKKWNLPVAHETSADATLLLSGRGMLSLSSDTVVDSGMFDGTVNLNGKRLVLPSQPLPFNAATVPSDGRELWIDPSLNGAVVYGEDVNKPTEVAFIHARDNAGLLTGDNDRCVASPYSADVDWRVRTVTGARALGRAATWLDFSNGYGNDKYRNHLQVKEKLSTPLPEIYSDTATFKSINVKAGFFALDTTRGGGSVIVSSVNGKTAPFKPRGENDPIWKAGEGSVLDNADTYLDGVQVDGTTAKYSRRPEVMSFNLRENDEPQSAKVFGFSDTQATEDKVNPEIMGEWILYSTTQTESVRKGIEAYLMWKWLGKVYPGYSDFRGMTVEGDGVIAAVGPEYLPELTESFTGSLEFSRTLWEFVLPKDGGAAAVDAIDLSGREVVLPATITVKINCRGAANGTYSLFKADALTGVEDVSISDDSNLGNKRATLIVSENEISVCIESVGLKMVIR